MVDARDPDCGVRQLVLVYGRERARFMVEPERRRLVDIAAEVMADDAGKIGITYTGFCLTGLPHKRLPDDQAWEKRGHRVTLMVEPGRMRVSRASTKLYGVPYGARARMILLYLQTQAIRTGSREVELGRSMRDWLGRMGLSWGGETGKALKEQATRIAACSLKFFWDDEQSGASPWSAGRFVTAGLTFHDGKTAEPRQTALFEERVILDEVFFNALREHPVPLREVALRELADRSLSLDLYIWLAYRLHTINVPTPVRWAALKSQFGPNYSRLLHFMKTFKQALGPAVAAYPEAKLTVEEEGIVLYPSRPPVAPKLIAVGG